MDTSTPHIALKTENLSIGYTNKKQQSYIARDIDFYLVKGELAGIVGVNGIGKSTLLRTLGNIQPKLSGSITLDRVPLEQHTIAQLAAEVSVVLTEPIASKNLTVLELISLGRQPYTNWIGTLTEDDMEKISLALDMVQMSELKSKKCYELSDGQLQRVMIARAIAQDTQLILLDEPTTHLDLYHKVQILKLLKSIAHTTKKTILFTTHEIEIAIQLCDKMLILEKNQSTFGSPCELIEKKSFENLFPADIIIFDAQTGSFRVNK